VAYGYFEHSVIDAPWYQLSLDANQDGVTTISDLTSFLSSVFYLPSDSLLFFIFDISPFVTFFEIERTYDHGFLSTLWSLWMWAETLWWPIIITMDVRRKIKNIIDNNHA
jgi:hypothetical protein